MNACIDCGEERARVGQSARRRCKACRRRFLAEARIARAIERGACPRHPVRRVARDGVCRECAALGSTRGRDPRPYLVIDVEQHASAELPGCCPKCGARPPSWRLGTSSARCWICGYDWFVASDDTITAEGAARLIEEQEA